MTTPLDYPTLISQLPQVSKLVNAEMLHPELYRELNAPLMEQKLREEQAKVQQVEKTDRSSAVDRDGHNASGGGGGGPHHERKEREPAEDEGLASNASPWSGNLINIKI